MSNIPSRHDMESNPDRMTMAGESRGDGRPDASAQPDAAMNARGSARGSDSFDELDASDESLKARDIADAGSRDTPRRR